MSKLMDDLNKVNKSRESEVFSQVQGASDVPPAREVPVVNHTKAVYFIGFLIAVIVGVSAAAMGLTLKMMTRLENVEAGGKVANAEVLNQLKASQETNLTLLEAIEGQKKSIDNLKAAILEKEEGGLAQAEELKSQMDELTASVNGRMLGLDELEHAQADLKEETNASIKDLELANRLIRGKYQELNAKVKKMVEGNSYFYGAY